jgi:hypothetical protein
VRRVNLARESLDLTAGTEMPRACAISLAEYLLACRSSTTSLNTCGNRRIASLSNSSLSFRANQLSGFSAGDFTSQHS